MRWLPVCPRASKKLFREALELQPGLIRTCGKPPTSLTLRIAIYTLSCPYPTLIAASK